MIGRTISHYKILEKLGEGGMGVVYKAEDTNLNRLVALKFLPNDLMVDSDSKKRFYQEAQAAASITHPNVCTIYEVEEIQNKTFIVMEYLKGQSLKETIKSGPLSINKVLEYIIQIVEGLRGAHKQEIIHRDIKSANIIITEEGTAKVLDFGLAKLKKQTQTTAKGVVKGTVAYMSPEQTTGDKIDHRTDIWSLGVVLYEMLIGNVPFKGGYQEAVMYSILNEDPEPITALRTGVPMELERILNKTLEKSKSERYQHLDDLIVDLQKLKTRLESGEFSVKKGISKVTARKHKKVRYITIIALIVFITIIAVGGYLLFKVEKKPAKPETKARIQKRARIKIVILPFKNLTGDKEYDNWKAGIQQCMITDLYQSKYVNVVSSPVLIGIQSKLNLLTVQNYSDKDLKEIAALSGATHILQGYLTRAGDSNRINVTIQETNTMGIQGTKKVEGKGVASFHAMIDELTPGIKAIFNISDQAIANDIDMDAAQISSSPAALNYFNEGLKLFEGRRFEESIGALEKAIDIDPGYASAYHQISVIFTYLKNYSQAQKYLEKALKYKDRVSLRDRLLIQAWSYSIYQTSYQKRINIYKEILKSYPDDERTLLNLAAVYRNSEDWELAVDYFNKALETNDKSEIAYQCLSYIFMAKGWYQKARDILVRNERIFSNRNYFHRYLAHTYILQGKYENALIELEQANELKPGKFNTTTLTGNVYHIKGDLLLAENFYKQLVKNKDPKAKVEGHLQMANLYLMQGKYDRCEKEINLGIKHSQQSGQKMEELNFMVFLTYLNIKKGYFTKALKVSNQIIEITGENKFMDIQKFSLHLRGLSDIYMNNIEKAKEKARLLKQLIEKAGNKKHMRLYYHLLGTIALKNNQVLKSIDYFKKAISLLPYQVYGISNHSFYFDSLASAYYKIGDMENARKQYEKIVSLTMGKLHWGDIYVSSYYWLGNISQNKGWKGKAVEYYEKFLEIWKNADPGIPEVNEARKKLIILRKELGE